MKKEEPIDLLQLFPHLNKLYVRTTFFGVQQIPYPFTKDDILEVLRIPNKLTGLLLLSRKVYFK